jgi:hypothetical protein
MNKLSRLEVSWDPWAVVGSAGPKDAVLQGQAQAQAPKSFFDAPPRSLSRNLGVSLRSTNPAHLEVHLYFWSRQGWFRLSPATLLQG